jgi:hypothetical protein
MHHSEGSTPKASQFQYIRSRMQCGAVLGLCYRPGPPEYFALCEPRADVSQAPRSHRCTRDARTGGQCTPRQRHLRGELLLPVWWSKQIDTVLHIRERIPLFICKRSEPVEVAARASARKPELPLCAISGGIQCELLFVRQIPVPLSRSATTIARTGSSRQRDQLDPRCFDL